MAFPFQHEGRTFRLHFEHVNRAAGGKDQWAQHFPKGSAPLFAIYKYLDKHNYGVAESRAWVVELPAALADGTTLPPTYLIGSTGVRCSWFDNFNRSVGRNKALGRLVAVMLADQILRPMVPAMLKAYKERARPKAPLDKKSAVGVELTG